MKAHFIYEALGFTEDSDPIKDMEIGHDAQMKKLNQSIKWDWYPADYEFACDEEIIDIITYRDLHLKISRIIREYFDGGAEEFYIPITDTGEPYIGDGPYKFSTPEEALKSGKSALDNYIDE